MALFSVICTKRQTSKLYVPSGKGAVHREKRIPFFSLKNKTTPPSLVKDQTFTEESFFSFVLDICVHD